MIKEILPVSKLVFYGLVGDGFDGASYWYVKSEDRKLYKQSVKLCKRDRAALRKLVKRWAMAEWKLEDNNPYFRAWPKDLPLDHTHSAIRPSIY